ncbi:MAG: arsenate reductase ArsC [Candidatus Margulisiibacteriota bacterium]
MKPRVLFLCTGNSCRSQMAEGFLRALGGNRFEAYSAGTKPAGVNPLTVEIMAEASIDISKQYSKTVQDLGNIEFDYLVTVCDNARQSCPMLLGNHKKLHWDLKDPADARGTKADQLAIFREIREQIREYVTVFLKNK